MIDLKDTYFHVSILPTHNKLLRFAFGGEGSSPWPSTLTPYFIKVCGCCAGSIATPGHPHTQLHRRLIDLISIRADGGSTLRCRSCSHGSAGAKTKCHLSGRGVGFDHDAGMYVTCSDRGDTHCNHESERRPVTHCKAVSETAGFDGSCFQRDTSWPAVHETLAVVASLQANWGDFWLPFHSEGHFPSGDIFSQESWGSSGPLTWTLCPAWPKPFYTLEQGMFRRSPPRHHWQSYYRPSVLLISGA